MGIPIAIRCSPERLRLLATAIEAAREAVLITDHSKAGEPIIYANPAFSRLTGYAPDEVLGRSGSFLQNGDRLQESVAMLAAAVRGGRPQEVVVRNYRKNGEMFLNRLSLTPIEDDRGRVTHFVGLLLDVTEQLQSVEALRTSEARWRGLFEHMLEGFYLGEAIRDADGRMIDFLMIEMNPAVERLTGIEPKAAIGRSFRALLPEAGDALIRHYEAVLDSGRPDHFEVQMPTLNNRWYEVRVQKVGAERFSVLFLEITARKDIEVALRQSESKFRTFAQTMPNHVWTASADGKIDWYNDKVYEYSGRRPGELDGDGWSSIVHPDDVHATIAAWRRALQSGGAYQSEFRLKSADGMFRWFITRALPIRDAQGGISRWIGTNTDIDAQKTETARLDYLGSHDALTGLLNRHGILEILETLLRAAHDDGSTLAVLFIDLDRFKELNDAFGHARGDGVLREIANRLSDLKGRRDYLARIGGDEFVVVAKVADRQAAVKLVERILTAASAGLVSDGAEFSIGASVGVVYYPEGGTTAEQLLRNADIAMYAAKLAGRGVWRVFDPAMAAQQWDKLQTSNDLKRAIGMDEMRLYYQPTFSLKSGYLNGAEALLRWQHPTRGLLGAHQFVSIAEESQTIVMLGRWVLEQACRQLVAWERRGLRAPRISVNLAARHVVDESLPGFVGTLLARYGIDPSRIGVEVTESMVMSDVGAAARVLGALHGMGISIALDDFGTGFSNITYLQRFSFDSLKIDKSFIDAIGTVDEGSAAKLTQAVIAMSAALGLRTIAEGVETPAQMKFLRAQGCDAVQGFLFSLAVTEQAFAERFLACNLPHDILAQAG